MMNRLLLKSALMGCGLFYSVPATTQESPTTRKAAPRAHRRSQAPNDLLLQGRLDGSKRHQRWVKVCGQAFHHT
jgi:hypothetical protein